MDFELTDDQKMLADTVAQYARQSSPVERFRKLRDTELGFERSAWKQMGELGWLSVPFPESVGGFGGSFVEVALILEKLGTTLVPEPYIPSVVLGGGAILGAGDDAQQARFLTPMIEGDLSLALAHSERESRYNVRPIKTRAERSAKGWKITGEKVWVLNGHAADHLVVSADTGEGIGLFVLDRDTANMTIHSVKTIDGHRAAILVLQGAEVEADRLLGRPDSGAEVLERVFDHAAAAACAEGVGIVQSSLDMTVAYLKERKQFDVPIGSFQALQHRAVDMFVETQLCRSMMYLAAIRANDPDPTQRRRDISAAKVQLTVGGRFVVQQAIQLHGGIGITDEHDIGLYFKRMTALNTLFGDEEHHVARFASLPSFATDLG